MTKGYATMTDRERCEKYASLVFTIGTIIEDRREGELDDGTKTFPEEDAAKLWAHLWQNDGMIYDYVSPLIDQIENEVFGGPVEFA